MRTRVNAVAGGAGRLRLSFGELEAEFGPMLRLAGPLAVAELGWMAMGIADTIMAGPLGPGAVGAGVLGNMVFYPIAVSLVGLLFGMDTLVAQAFGAGDERDCRRTLVHGLWMAAAITPVGIGLLLASVPAMRLAGVNPPVMALCVPYLDALLCGVLPLLLFTALRRYLQAMNVVKPVTFALVTANLINLAGDWALMYGHLGAPRMGLAGSGWATSISRVYMMLVLLAAAARPLAGRDSGSGRRARLGTDRPGWRVEWARLRRLMALGLPAAGQIAFEGAVFGVVTVLAARLDEVSLAAHGIAVQVISTTFMVPLGISSAAAVRVGQAMGRRDPRGVAAAGWAAMLLSSLFMGVAGIAFWTVPGRIVRLFIANGAVVAMGSVLLRIAAFLELFDGLQVVATGALRGLGDTRTPMLAHLAGYWAIGMPMIYGLCFSLGMGARGIWIGLSTALILIGAALAQAWRVRLREVT